MPPKRRGAQPKAPAPNKPPPDPPRPSKQASPPMPPPPLSLLVESDAAKVRKEWSKFVDAWYEPQKKNLVEKLKKELLVKYKNLGSPKDTQKLREMELFEKLDAIAQQLAQPARTEWERRLELAQLREDQWDDMSGEEQQAVMGVFVGFFSDEVDDMQRDVDMSIEEEGIIDEPQYRAPHHLPPIPPAPSRQAIPPTPTRGNFEFVNPTSFFIDTMTPPNPTRNLPALPMDHLATLDPSNSARPAEPVSGGVGGTLGFQNWASEVGIVTQQSTKLPLPGAQTLTARPRATDNMSRQTSAASNLSSPLSKTTSPQFSPPNPTTKFSPPINPESLPLGKRYIGPVITEEEPDPMDEEILKSKMADDYQQYKISLRIQMIYQFHAEAADIEIKLFESLLADEGTKESRARAVQEHETSMMRLREQKEEDRKRLCAEEREKRRQEIRQHLAQRRSTVEPPPKPSPQIPPPDKTLAQQRQGKLAHQKENVPLPASTKPEPPSVIKKSNSMLSQNEAAANEAVFANAMAVMAQGKGGATGLSTAQASLNEAIFSNAAATLTTQGPLESSANRTLQPSIMKKSISARLQEHDVPHITVSLAEATAPEPAQVPSITAKGKKGRKGQSVAKPITTEEPEMDAELLPGPSLWDVTPGVAKSAWGAASVSKPKLDDVQPTPTPAAPKGNTSTKKVASATKKGKKVTITEEPDVDADPIVSPPVKTTARTSAWGSPSKSKTTPVPEESEETGPTVASGWGNKLSPTASSSKPSLKVSLSEEAESEVRGQTGKSAWATPAASTSSTQAGKKAAPPEVGRGGNSACIEPVPEPEQASQATTTGDGEAEAHSASDWFNPENMSYWANVMAGQPEETEAVEEPMAQAGKHVRWTPTMNESDEEGGFGEEALATNVWMQYAISGGDIPSLDEEPQDTPFATQPSLWEGKKKANGDSGNRAQQTSAFDRAGFPGQWPKMEWLSPPARGQNSGSTRVF